MGIGVGSSKQEFNHDLNAAGFEYKSATDTSGNWVRVAKILYAIFFHFSTRVSKDIFVYITIEDTSGDSHIIHTFHRKSPESETSYIWHPQIELTANMDVHIVIPAVNLACLFNMAMVDR